MIVLPLRAISSDASPNEVKCKGNDITSEERHQQMEMVSPRHHRLLSNGAFFWWFLLRVLGLRWDALNALNPMPSVRVRIAHLNARQRSRLQCNVKWSLAHIVSTIRYSFTIKPWPSILIVCLTQLKSSNRTITATRPAKPWAEETNEKNAYMSIFNAALSIHFIKNRSVGAAEWRGINGHRHNTNKANASKSNCCSATSADEERFWFLISFVCARWWPTHNSTLDIAGNRRE